MFLWSSARLYACPGSTEVARAAPARQTSRDLEIPVWKYRRVLYVVQTGSLGPWYVITLYFEYSTVQTAPQGLALERHYYGVGL
jgi:hypothetical protein